MTDRNRLPTVTLPFAAMLVVLLSSGGTAQQKVPFRGNTPIAPSGIPRIPLPTEPVIYTMGHRNSLGLAVHPGTGEVWQNDEDNGAVLRIEPAP